MKNHKRELGMGKRMCKKPGGWGAIWTCLDRKTVSVLYIRDTVTLLLGGPTCNDATDHWNRTDCADIDLHVHRQLIFNRGFPGGFVAMNTPASAGDIGSIPGWGRSPGEGNGNPLQYSCLGNSVDRRT